MRSNIPLPLRVLALAAFTAAPSVALAQPAPAGNAGGEEGAAPPPANGQGPTIVQIPPAAPQYPGTLPPQGWDPDAHLPSSSHSSTDISKSTDGFDMIPKEGGHASVHGGANGQFLSEGSYVPDGHTVRRGETLWEISTRYYQNPYQWPRLWSYNPQIQNPHWIYPGDRVRLRDDRVAGSVNQISLLGRRSVPAGTVFLRDQGWVDDKNDDTWGEVVGSPSDRMMLGEGDDVYVQIGGEHEVALGDKLTIFRPIRTVGSENATGEMVSIRGTAKIERYNPRTKMARAKIVESLDVIERGAKIGPVGRQFDVVSAVKSDVDLEANILAAVYPNTFYGQNQVVFIDRGEKDGVRVGMRFFAVMHGDRWRNTLDTAGDTGRPRVEDDRPARVDPSATEKGDEDRLPDETYAELRVMRMRDHTATAIVVQARHEIERDARLVARKGY